MDKTTGLKCDQTISLTNQKSSLAYPDKLRRSKFYSEAKGKTYVFLTNNFELDALTITYTGQQTPDFYFHNEKAKSDRQIREALGLIIKLPKENSMTASIQKNTILSLDEEE